MDFKADDARTVDTLYILDYVNSYIVPKIKSAVRNGDNYCEVCIFENDANINIKMDIDDVCNILEDGGYSVSCYDDELRRGNLFYYKIQIGW